MAEDQHTEIPNDRRYTAEHEWALRDGDVVQVGITDYAQHELGDVVYTDLPKVGEQVTGGGDMGAIESVKAASDIFSPVTGAVVAVNEELGGAPGRGNHSPHQPAWMGRLRKGDSSWVQQLLDPA